MNENLAKDLDDAISERLCRCRWESLINIDS